MHSLEKVNNFDPDNHHFDPNKQPKYGRRAQQASMWSTQASTQDLVKAEQKKSEEAMMKMFSKRPEQNVETQLAKKQIQPVKRKREPSPPLVCTPEAIDSILNDEYNEEENVEIIYKSRFFSKEKPAKKTSGNWLEDLEDSSPSNEQLKYTPDVESKNVLRQAFKPVTAASLNSEVLAQKRNPFAKKTPEKKAKFEFKPLEVKSEQVKNSQEIVPVEEHLKEDKVESPEKPPAKAQVEEKSQYFQKHQPPPAKRGVSGLLKPSSKKKSPMNNGAKQPSLLDMWCKKH